MAKWEIVDCTRYDLFRFSADLVVLARVLNRQRFVSGFLRLVSKVLREYDPLFLCHVSGTLRVRFRFL
jgi:hypothetical protein